MFLLTCRLLLDCLAGCRVRFVSPHQDEDLGAKMRRVIGVAGA